jgi:hypothetical protein
MTKTNITSKRTERKPLHSQGPQSIATGALEPGFQYRFVNDIGSRIENFKAAGYEFVEDDTLAVGDSRVSDPSAVGSAKVVTSNDGTKSYLMRIKDEWYKEDQQVKQKRIDELEKAIKSPSSQGVDYGDVKLK